MRTLIMALCVILAGCGPALQYVKHPSDPPTTEARFQADREACGNVTMPYIWPVLAAPFVLIQGIRAERAKACMKERGWHPTPP